MFTKIAITAAAIAVSAPALAMSATQLELSLGVAPGVYTLTQLSVLDSAEDAKEFNRLINYIDGQGDASVSRAADASTWVPVKERHGGEDR